MTFTRIFGRSLAEHDEGPDQTLATLAALIREAMSRLSRDGWKRNATWLLTELGGILELSAAYLYKNYPDRAGRLTAVRLYSWHDPVDPPRALGLETRVIGYDEPLVAGVRDSLESGQPGVTRVASSLGSADPSDLVVFAPVRAGDEWWGFIAALLPEARRGHLENVTEFMRLVASILGDAVRDASVQQALRWSERLHRIQRDIALAAAAERSTTDSISELLALICEFGDFDAGAVDLVESGSYIRLAVHGTPPGSTPAEWCDSCRDLLLPASPAAGASYLGSGDVVHRPACPVARGGFHAAALVPLVHDGAVAGALELFSTRRTHVPGSVRRTLETVAVEISMLLAQVRQDQSLRAMAERYQLAVEAGRIGVWEYNPSRQVFLVDPPVHEFFQFDPDLDEIDAERVYACLQPGDRDRLRAWLETAASGDAFEREVEISSCAKESRKPIQPRWIVLRARGRRDLQGAVRIVGTMLDVTATRLIQEELRLAQRESDAQSRARGNFIARMSHEFRTPLNAILGYSQVMRRDHQRADADSSDDSLELIEHSARHLLTMVENLLDHNRLEAGRVRIAMDVVSLSEFLNDLERVADVLMREKQLRFVVRVSGDPPARLTMDGGRVRQVLYNLLSNAAKFTDDGTVTLHVRWRGGRVRFAVSDTGIGVPPEDRGRVFLPFRQHGPRSDAGSGLGLSISQELVQLMGSRIWLSSVAGRGSTFWFSIQAAAEPESGRADSGRVVEAAVEPGADDIVATSNRLRADELRRLRELARIGDLGSIREHVAQLVGVSPNVDRVLGRLDRLAARFEVRAVQELLVRLESTRHE